MCAEGKHGQNAERSLQNLTACDMRVQQELIRLPVRYYAKKSRSKRNITGLVHIVEWVDWPVLPLWEICSLITESNGFNEHFLPEPGMAAKFWHDFKRQSYAATHSIQDCADSELEAVVPLTFHVDGVKIFKGSGNCTEAVVYSASSALVKATSLKCQWAITAVPLHLFTKDTNAFIVFYIRYLLRVLKSGARPPFRYNASVPVDHSSGDARFFPPGHSARLAFVKTDLKENMAQHQYRTHTHTHTHFGLLN